MGWNVSVITRDVLFAFVPRVPVDQRSSVSALLTLGAGLLFVVGLSWELQDVSQHPWPLYLLDAISSPLPLAVTIKSVSRHCQMSSGGVTPG